MVTPLTQMDVAWIAGRLRHFYDLPKEKILSLTDTTCEPCDDQEGTRLFDALRQGEPTTRDTAQFQDHVLKCTACQEFMRYMVRVASFTGY